MVRVVQRSAEGVPGAFFSKDAWLSLHPNYEPIQFGNRVDPVTRLPVGECADFATWYVGEDQVAPLLHGDKGRFSRYVCVGSAGSGKSTIGVYWAIRRAMQHGRNGAIGCVAPTQPRLRVLWGMFLQACPPRWITQIQVNDRRIHFVNGCSVDFVAAKEHSSATGSPLQGYTFSTGILFDEEQDISDQSMADGYVRGRNAAGKSYCLSTCTLKRSLSWLRRKRAYDADSSVMVKTMTIANSPFISPTYVKELKQRLTPSQYRMLVLAEEAPPDNATYPDFEPRIHCRKLKYDADITRQIVGSDLLVGHDPGVFRDISVVYKAFANRGDPEPTWGVVGALATKGTTSEAHARQLFAYIKGKWGSGKIVEVRADPYGDTDVRPHVTVYREFSALGFKIKPAQYSPNGGPGKLPKNARIDVVCRLMLNADGETRFYIDLDDDGLPVAPDLVDALHLSQRDDSGRAEMDDKRYKESDHSDWSAAAGYGLWAYEKKKTTAKPALRLAR